MRSFLLFALLLVGTAVFAEDTIPSQKTITVVPRGSVTSNQPSLASLQSSRQGYVGFNTSYLLQQILPFNAIPIQQNMYGLTYRKYNTANNRGYRISFGANLSELDELQWFAFRIDRDRRKIINDRWRYFYGQGVGLEVFQDPDNINFFFTETEVNVLGQLHWGVEYKINAVMSLSLECQAILKLGSSSSLVLRPPTVITAHFALNQ